MRFDGFVGRAGFDLRHHDVIDGQHQLVAELGEQLLREIDLVVFDQRFADRLALRFQERVGHGAADQQLVDHLRRGSR